MKARPASPTFDLNVHRPLIKHLYLSLASTTMADAASLAFGAACAISCVYEFWHSCKTYSADVRNIANCLEYDREHLRKILNVLVDRINTAKSSGQWQTAQEYQDRLSNLDTHFRGLLARVRISEEKVRKRGFQSFCRMLTWQTWRKIYEELNKEVSDW